MEPIVRLMVHAKSLVHRGVYGHLAVDKWYAIVLKCMMAAPCLFLSQWNDEDGTRCMPDARTGMSGEPIPARTFKDVQRMFRKADV